MLAHDRVRAGRVDDVDLAQERRRVAVDDDAVAGARSCAWLAVDQQVDHAGRRRHPLGHDRLADQRVDEGRLAGVELADDHQQEQRLQLRLAWRSSRSSSSAWSEPGNARAIASVRVSSATARSRNSSSRVESTGVAAPTAVRMRSMVCLPSPRDGHAQRSAIGLPTLCRMPVDDAKFFTHSVRSTSRVLRTQGKRVVIDALDLLGWRHVTRV